MYDTLLNNTLYPYDHTEGDTSPGRTWKKPNDLSVCESEDRGDGEGVGLYGTLMVSETLAIWSRRRRQRGGSTRVNELFLF